MAYINAFSHYIEQGNGSD